MNWFKKIVVAINMVKHCFLELIFLILICKNAYALDKNFNELQIASNLTKIENILKDCSQDCLVIWDVDEVLITPTDKIFHTKNCANNLPSKYARAAIEKHSLSKKQAQWCGSKILLQRNMRLVEAGLELIIKKLQNNKIKTIALTKSNAGNYGAIANFKVTT